MIDQSALDAAALLNTIGDMLMGGIPNQDPETEEELYELACCEVESILAARKQAKRFVRDHATSDRWAELAAKIL